MRTSEVDWLAEIGEAAEGRRVLEIAETLTAAGATPVLVGGAVRDALLETGFKDLDVEVFGLELSRVEEVLGRFGEVHSVGRAFGVLLIGGLAVDFSLPRKDSKTAPGHRGFEIEFDPRLSFEEASRRRDLSINSMGVDLRSGELLDPHGGLADLERGVLRATDPVAFGEDPLRGLRVAQFAARLCMEPDDELITLCASLDLDELPAERIGEEFRKLLCKGREPSRGLRVLERTGLLRFFPELLAMVDVAQDPEWHPEGDVWIHTQMCLDRAVEMNEADSEADELLMYSVLCHDLGKPATTEDIDGRVRSLGHDRAGVAPTLAFLDRLAVRNELKEQVAAMVEHHLAPALFVKGGAKARAYRGLARRLDAVGLTLRELERVARADYWGRTTDEALRGVFPAGDEFLAHADELRIAERGPIEVVRGRDLIARGLEPSPRFGAILKRCREIQDASGETDIDAILNRALDEGP